MLHRIGFFILIPLKYELVLFLSLLVLLLPRTFMFPFIRPQMCFDYWSVFHELPTLKFVSIGFLFSYLLTAWVCVTKSRLLKTMIYVFFYLLFFINIFLALNFKAAISPSTLLLFVETTPAETKDFLSTYALTFPSIVSYVAVILIAIANVYFEKNRGRITQWIRTRKFVAHTEKAIVVISLILLANGLYSCRIYHQLFSSSTVEEVDGWNTTGLSSMDLVTGLVYSIYDLKLLGQVLYKAEESTIQAVRKKVTLKNPNDSCNIVLVIGESFIKRHSSLYGYSLQTNPRLQREQDAGRLVVFSDVITSSGGTSLSIRNIMSCNSVGDGEKWYDCPYSPALFKIAGYNVYFWDNQYEPTSSAGYNCSLNSYLHSKSITDLSYNAWHEYISNYDGDIVENFANYKRAHRLGRKNLVMFHLQGQHFKQEARYPLTKEFQKFTSNDIKRSESWMTEEKKWAIAHYDNCTNYNDSVISAIISIFREEPTVLVYFSDHGECVYDVGDVAGRQLTYSSVQNEMVQCVFEIPFVVWYSNKFFMQYPQVIENLRAASERPMMTDNVCHFLMNLGGVESKFYKSSLDVMSDNYKCPPRIVLEGLEYVSNGK